MTSSQAPARSPSLSRACASCDNSDTSRPKGAAAGGFLGRRAVGRSDWSKRQSGRAAAWRIKSSSRLFRFRNSAGFSRIFQETARPRDRDRAALRSGDVSIDDRRAHASGGAIGPGSGTLQTRKPMYHANSNSKRRSQQQAESQPPPRCRPFQHPVGAPCPRNGNERSGNHQKCGPSASYSHTTIRPMARPGRRSSTTAMTNAVTPRRNAIPQMSATA